MRERHNNISVYRIIASIIILQFHVFFILYPDNIFGSVYLSKFVQGLTALSGLLLSQSAITSIGKFYWSRFKRIIIPILVVVILTLLCNIIFMIATSNYSVDAFIGYRAYNHSLLIQFGNLYYIGDILICYLITPVLKKSNIAGILLFLIFGFIETSVSYWIDPLYIISVYIIGFYIGKFFYNNFVGKYHLNDIVTATIFAVITFLSIAVSIYLQKEGYPILGKYNHIILNVLYGVFGISSMLLLLIIFKFFNYFKGFPRIELAYYIFILNQVFMVGATNISVLVSEFYQKNLLIYGVVIFAAVFLSIATKIISGLKKKSF